MNVQLKNNPMSYTSFFYTIHLIHACFDAMKNCPILFKRHCISAPDKQSKRLFEHTHINAVFCFTFNYTFNVV